MEKILMVDLKSQYIKIKNEIDEAIQGVINSSSFIRGAEVTRFEQALAQYLEVKHVIGCANGTDALQIAMMALELEPGDEVITTNFSFIATVEAIQLLGLNPVLTDVNPRTFNIDVSSLEDLITDKTKAIIPVHLYGQCADMNALRTLANKHQIHIIEDAAQAMGSEYFLSSGLTAKAGSMGTIGCTSFFPSKNLGCFGDGGALMTNDDQLAGIIRSITNHGSEVKYYHQRLGVNSRLDTLQAAVLKVKLQYLDQYNEARKSAADFYDAALSDLPNVVIPKRCDQSSHIFHQYTITLEEVNRDKLQAYLKDNGIPTMVYYPVPMHQQKAFKGLGYKTTDFPVTDKLCQQVLSLPMHSELNQSQQSYIVEKIADFLNNHG